MRPTRRSIALRILPSLALVSLLLSLAVPAFAQRPTIVKLATLVPERSVWGLLRDLTEEWKEITDGQVVARIYPGGVAGDDPDIVRKMRIGQLQAATITVTGLAEIDEAFNVFSIPLFYESYEEYFYVLHSLEPVLRERLEAEGLHPPALGSRWLGPALCHRARQHRRGPEAVEAFRLGGKRSARVVVEGQRVPTRAASPDRCSAGHADRHDRGSTLDAAGGAVAAVVSPDSLHVGHGHRPPGRRHGHH